jgi:putative transposase
VKALGADTGISKSEVSRICADLDAQVGAFRDRDLSALDYPYGFLDATYCKARVNHRVVSQAIVVAFGVAADGRREVLGFDVGDSESEALWTEFLRSLKARGLDGVKLVISDAHSGLKKAIGTVVQGAAWQRCRVHFMRNVLAVIPRAGQEMVASIIRTVFAQPDRKHVNAQFDEVTRMLERSHPKVAQMLQDARDDLRAFCGFPSKHWRQIWSTNPMERVNKEIKRRTDVVGVFPNPAALLRLAGAVWVEQHDEWEAGDRRYFSESSMRALDALTAPAPEPVEPVIPVPELTAAESKPADRPGVEKLHHKAGRDQPLSFRDIWWAVREPVRARIPVDSVIDFPPWSAHRRVGCGPAHGRHEACRSPWSRCRSTPSRPHSR